jgi:type II secretory pathway component PulK
LGVDRDTRNRLVDSVLDWIDADDIPHLYGGEVADYPVAPAGQLRRPRNAAFQTVDELLLVRNMTEEIFFGSLVQEPSTGRYRRIPGLRDLVTVQSGDARVNPNLASVEVLMALPLMNAEIAAHVAAERESKNFENADDLVKRVPELTEKDTLDYLRFDNGSPVELVSKAVIGTTGISRTVRMLFKREERLQFITLQPLVYKRVIETKFDRWRFE